MRGYRYASAGTTVLTLALALYGCGKDATAPPEHRVAAPVDMASLTGGADLPGLAAAAGPRSSDPCTYSEATGRFTCPPVTRNGLTITRSFAYLDAGGQPQARYDAETTASVNMQTAVQGSTTRGAASVTVERSADVTVSGLAGSETTRTVNGTESGTVVTSGTGERGAFRSTTASADTTSNVVLPVRGSASRWPLSGSV
ncbi:MAG: hypothetical protein HY703_01115, partial [Gemmatimonadetes bacterium]|nr:hypothetical protein [Gemmatimonadota bacterium]